MRKRFRSGRRLREDLIILSLSFLTISSLSLSKDIFVDEAMSLFCSKYYLTDCKFFDPQSPLFYFFLKISSLILGLNIIIHRIFLSLFVATSVLLIIRAVSLYKKLKFRDKLILCFIISFTPVIYSSSLVRPYVFSLLFSSISIFNFLNFLKSHENKWLIKSYFFDLIGGIFFYFNLLLIPIKAIFLINRKETFIPLLLVLLLAFLLLFPLFLISREYSEARMIATRWYKNYEDYLLAFLFNFPVELLKHQVVGKVPHSLYFLVFVKISQIVFLLSLVGNDKSLINLYILIMISILILFSLPLLQNLYFIFSRHFIALTVYLLTLAVILFPFNLNFFLILPITFIFQTIFYIQTMFTGESYGACYKVYDALNENSEVIVSSRFSSCLWYYELMGRKNITIFEPFNENWFERNETSFMRWKIGASEFEMPRLPVTIEDHNYLIKVISKDKIFICRKLMKEINSTNGMIFICK